MRGKRLTHILVEIVPLIFQQDLLKRIFFNKILGFELKVIFFILLKNISFASHTSVKKNSFKELLKKSINQLKTFLII